MFKKKNKYADVPIQMTYFFFGFMVLFIMLHTIFYGLMGSGDLFFLFLTLVMIAGFCISIFINLYSYMLTGEPKNIWQLGWLGLAGLVGLLPDYGPDFYGLFGFFGFFGTKK